MACNATERGSRREARVSCELKSRLRSMFAEGAAAAEATEDGYWWRRVRGGLEREVEVEAEVKAEEEDKETGSLWQ